MTMLKTILGALLFLSPLNSFAQTVLGDSCIVLTPTEARVLTQMTEDLKYTKQELQVCDSIGEKKDVIIEAQKAIITEKDAEIKKEKKKSVKAWIISGLASLIVGLIIGGLAF